MSMEVFYMILVAVVSVVGIMTIAVCFYKKTKLKIGLILGLLLCVVLTGVYLNGYFVRSDEFEKEYEVFKETKDKTLAVFNEDEPIDRDILNAYTEAKAADEKLRKLKEEIDLGDTFNAPKSVIEEIKNETYILDDLATKEISKTKVADEF